ncbi:MAG: hypothetical protein JWM80_2079 [Cyanobacteria bacterium RYN_339]|nr:hypothetical protein [Cyanobacteria bacterium RYN_339]
MKIARYSVTAAVLASAIASAGCSQDVFTSINKTLTVAKQGASALKNTTLPAAAIATSLGAVELIKALSSSSKGLVAQGGGNISGGQLPGGGPANIVAAGAGNFTNAPMFHIAADESKDVANDATKVKMHVAYSTSKQGDTYVSTITDFSGVTQGYTLSAKGTFKYTPGATLGSVSCEMTGSVKYSALSLDIKQLSFSTTDPLPEKNAELGKFRFEQNNNGKTDYALDAKLAINGSGKIEATGTSTGPDGKAEPVNFSQDKPTGESLDTGAGASADANAAAQ